MNLWLRSDPNPLIVAHRGSSATHPENTLDAFRQAIADYADAIELDVQLTRDGRVVIFHDFHLNRTTDGKGRLRDHTLRELRSLNASYRTSPGWRIQRIPTLEEVFELVGRKIGINIEMKVDRRTKNPESLVDRTCEIVRLFHARSNVLLTSFSVEALRRVRTHHRGFATGLLHYPLAHRSRSPLALAEEVGARYLVVSGAAVNRRLVRNARRKELRLGEYTVNSSLRVRRAFRYGLDMMITDDPRKVRRYISSIK
ncbi:MAG TPA: glycerophosphodiester phosphodiesterase family protein [Bacteroidota bacterium]|nr:glycerophosphodiester phosphodiesterase family protein [Bacteroidota bacterium]